MSHPALTQLRALRYFDAIPALAPHLVDWRLLEGSMPSRGEHLGQRVP
ncbi:chorismate lyase, partial [Salmonella enterica subsp. enterica serovar Poona]